MKLRFTAASRDYVPGMFVYRAHWVRPDGHLVGLVRLLCQDDAVALEQSRLLVDHRPVELWCGERFIARLEPHSRPDTCQGHESRMTRRVWPHLGAKSKHSVDGRARGRREDRVHSSGGADAWIMLMPLGASNVLTTVDDRGPYPPG
jgi:hypothetical protein